MYQLGWYKQVSGRRPPPHPRHHHHPSPLITACIFLDLSLSQAAAFIEPIVTAAIRQHRRQPSTPMFMDLVQLTILHADMEVMAGRIDAGMPHHHHN
jgi:hypothetical protein